ILTSEGVAKLTDLGLARDADDVEAAKKEAGRAYGTPYYISPEQIRGELDIDFRTDIYSLGATLYHMVTGRPPYEGDSPTVVMHKHLTEQLIPADHVNTALSAGLGEIIDVAMAKRREERYSSTQAMVEDLKAVRDNKPPTHGRRAIDLDSLAKVEETGKTVDIVPVGGAATATDIWRSPAVIGLAITAGVSLLCNLIMLAVLMARK
ncbi:MAG TPA: serine/threonine-protein kinase, partial [Rhizomicrobium sp.]|nr:serine/threonine-protein kinase [Rhizomicrobium sp.]